MLTEQNGWRRMAEPSRRQLGFFPNLPFLNDERCLAAVVVRQSDRGDWAISKKAIDYYLSINDNESRRHPWVADCWVVLVDPDWERVIASARCRDVEQKLLGVRPLYGRHGAHWWVDADFKNHDIHRETNPF
jgi:hypothetical protein